MLYTSAFQKFNANFPKHEDSGVSSRKSELSANINCELSAIELPEHSHSSSTACTSKDDYSSLDFSKRYIFIFCIYDDNLHSINFSYSNNANNTCGSSSACSKTELQSPSSQRPFQHKCFKLPVGLK